MIVGKGDDIEPQLAKSGLRYERIDFKDADQLRRAGGGAAAPAHPAAGP